MLIMKRLFVIAGALTEDGDRPDRAVQMQEGTAVFDSQDVVGECKKPVSYTHLEELREQVPVIKAVLKAMGVCTVEKGGLEAEDSLGTLAKKGEKDGYFGKSLREGIWIYKARLSNTPGLD